MAIHMDKTVLSSSQFWQSFSKWAGLQIQVDLKGFSKLLQFRGNGSAVSKLVLKRRQRTEQCCVHIGQACGREASEGIESKNGAGLVCWSITNRLTNLAERSTMKDPTFNHIALKNQSLLQQPDHGTFVASKGKLAPCLGSSFRCGESGGRHGIVLSSLCIPSLPQHRPNTHGGPNMNNQRLRQNGRAVSVPPRRLAVPVFTFWDATSSELGATQ